MFTNLLDTCVLYPSVQRDFLLSLAVENWEPYVGTFGLPDPDDEHVLGAAPSGHAGAVVTANLKDFPEDKIPPGIQIVTVNEFAANTVAVAPEVALTALATMSARSRLAERSRRR